MKKNIARQTTNKKNPKTSPKRVPQKLRALKTNRQKSAASAYSTGQSTSVPIIKATRSSSRIKHRELIASVTGNLSFLVASYSINPGLSNTFPWLSTQAVGWEQYHFNKLAFCYYTRTGTSTTGSFMMAPDYDAADDDPQSEEILSSYENCAEDAVWKDIVCNWDEGSMHPDGPRKYMRTGPLVGSLDIKTYDVGRLITAVIDGASVPWGKLWVEYDITFYTPQLPPSGGALSQFESNISPTPTSTNMLGLPGSITNVPGSSQVFAVSGETVTFIQGGTFVVAYRVIASGSATVISAPVAGNGAIIKNWLNSGTNAFSFGSGTTSVVQLMLIGTVEGGTIVFQNTLLGGNFAELSAVLVSDNFA